MKRISALLGGAVLGVAVLAACGGGGGGSGTSAPGGPIPPGGPTSAPTVAPSQNFSSTDAVTIPTPAPGATTVPVPLASDSSGASANAAIPASANVPPDATVASTFSSAGDSSLPALSIRRSTASVRGLREDGHKTVIAYLRLQFSADVSLPQAPAFTFVVPGTLPTTGVSYWLAFIDPLRAAAGWQTGFEGPATVTPAQSSSGRAGTQLAFASNGQPLNFVANQTYYFAVYAVSATAASPTPVPSTVPSNPPPDGKPQPVGVTPRNIQFTSVTASTPVPVTFVQQGFTGPVHPARRLHRDRQHQRREPHVDDHAGRPGPLRHRRPGRQGRERRRPHRRHHAVRDAAAVPDAAPVDHADERADRAPLGVTAPRAVAIPEPGTVALTDAGPVARTYADAGPVALADAGPVARTHADADAVARADRDADADFVAYAHAHAHADPVARADAGADRDAVAHADTDADSHPREHPEQVAFPTSICRRGGERPPPRRTVRG